MKTQSHMVLSNFDRMLETVQRLSVAVHRLSLPSYPAIPQAPAAVVEFLNSSTARNVSLILNSSAIQKVVEILNEPPRAGLLDSFEG